MNSYMKCYCDICYFGFYMVVCIYMVVDLVYVFYVDFNNLYYYVIFYVDLFKVVLVDFDIVYYLVKGRQICIYMMGN